MIITAHAFARAGLIGNPSDGYFGKTISCVIRNFRATVTMWESPHFEIIPGDGDLARFHTTEEFLRDQKLHGYYGGMRLVKATVKRFHDHCTKHDIPLDRRGFTIAHQSDIPRLVGLSGSSAIVVATLRALQQFYRITIPLVEMPALALSVEKEELGISAGLQDRVIQSYEGIVAMDFDRTLMESRGYGEYERLQPPQVPPLYVAYDPARAEVSDVPHSNLRERFNRGEPEVLVAMKKYRDLTDRGRECLMKSDWKGLGEIMDANFDLRRTIMPIAPENLRMVEAARDVGVSAKFAGSGGAICGLFDGGRQYQQLSDALYTVGCTVFRPLIFE
ncbi:MAG: GHMP kinase [Phycisphaerae bacterium]|nr:GHMP kinase [Phycisphaerae bacterium]